MHATCSNDLPGLSHTECPSDAAKTQMYRLQLTHLLDSTHSDVVASAATFLVCDTEEEARYMRLLLDQRGLPHIGTRVKAMAPAAAVKPAPARPAVLSEKEAYGQMMMHRPPRHQSQFTKAPGAGAQAKKAARRKAKAGRKAAR